MKGTKDITNAARTVKEVHDDFIRFSIKEALTTDAGAYFVVARNRYGIDRCFTNVTVIFFNAYVMSFVCESSTNHPSCVYNCP